MDFNKDYKEIKDIERRFSDEVRNVKNNTNLDTKMKAETNLSTLLRNFVDKLSKMNDYYKSNKGNLYSLFV